MKIKPEYILKKEKETEIYSVVDFPYFNRKLLEFFKTKKFKVVYQESNVDNDSVIRDNKVIYETEQKFYLSFEDSGDNERWSLTIYYNPDQYNELRFFINQLNKQYEKIK